MPKRQHTTYEDFSEMNYTQLHRELEQKLGEAQRISKWFAAAERLSLLPALQAMHDKIAQPGRRTDLIVGEIPTWEQECESLGISADLVKKWKQRAYPVKV